MQSNQAALREAKSHVTMDIQVSNPVRHDSLPRDRTTPVPSPATHGFDKARLRLDAKESTTAILAHLIRQHATTMAFSDALRIMAVLFLAALLLVPLIRKPHAPAPAAASEAH